MPLRILLVGGGSIGHIAPLVAVWREIQAMHPDATARVLCADRPEETAFCAKEDLPCDELPRLRMNAGLVGSFIRATDITNRVMADFKPDVVFCKGGSMSIPVCRLARRNSIPIVLHESDAVMGRANRVLSRWADMVCLGMDNQKHPADRFIVTGNPVRADILQGSRDEGLRIAGFDGSKPVVIVCGGSQGAQAINDAIAEQLPALLPHCNVIHLTGPGKSGAEAHPGYFSLPFAHDNLKHFYAASTLAVGRAGAGTISELNACGIPMILIPIRGLAQDHQWLNAQAARSAGYAELLPQEDIAHLSERIVALLGDAPRRSAMISAGKTLSPEAARRIAKIVANCVASGREGA